MKINETNQMMIVLETAYPQSYKGMSPTQAENTVVFFHSFFKDYEIELVVQALKNYIKSNKYSRCEPGAMVAGIQEQIDLIMSTDDTAIELWNAVSRAARNGLYGYQEEFDRLPQVCKTWLRVPEQLREFAMMDSDILDSVVKGQFLKTIKEVKDREKAKDGLPKSVVDMLKGEFVKKLE